MRVQILRFCIVGAVATIVHMAVAAALIRLPYPLAVWTLNLIAFTVAFWVSFFGHRFFTFRTDGGVFRFFIAGLSGLLFNNVCLTLAFWLTKEELLSIIVSAAISPIVVFAISRFWVFR